MCSNHPDEGHYSKTSEATMQLVRTCRRLACDYVRSAKRIDAMANPTPLERGWRDEYLVEAARLRRTARGYLRLFGRGWA